MQEKKVNVFISESRQWKVKRKRDFLALMDLHMSLDNIYVTAVDLRAETSSLYLLIHSLHKEKGQGNLY